MLSILANNNVFVPVPLFDNEQFFTCGRLHALIGVNLLFEYYQKRTRIALIESINNWCTEVGLWESFSGLKAPGTARTPTGGPFCSPICLAPNPRSPNCGIPTDSDRRCKSHIFIALRLHRALFEPLPQNHCSILDNPFIRFATLLAANPQNRVAGIVNPSKKYNPISEHLEFLRTVEANI